MNTNQIQQSVDILAKTFNSIAETIKQASSSATVLINQANSYKPDPQTVQWFTKVFDSIKSIFVR
jgi:hypothetical protein